MANWPGDDAVFPFCMPIIKQFEGYSAKPYLDSVGVATIGYGTTHYPDGAKVTMQDPACTDPEATSWLTNFMSGTSKQIAALLTRPATLHQSAAMLSLTYNIGAANFKSSSVLRKFNAGDIPGAADAFLMWDKGTVNGQKVVIPGLHNRRVEERTIFLTADS
jgi:lysozyme